MHHDFPVSVSNSNRRRDKRPHNTAETFSRVDVKSLSVQPVRESPKRSTSVSSCLDEYDSSVFLISGLYLGAPLSNVFLSFFLFKELEDMRQNGMRCFKNIQVDESNCMAWQGIIVPVSIGLLLPELMLLFKNIRILVQPIFVSQIYKLLFLFFLGVPSVWQRSLSHWDHLPCRVPVQATQGHFQDKNLPPQHWREGPDLLAHHQRWELEASHKNLPGWVEGHVWMSALSFPSNHVFDKTLFFLPVFVFCKWRFAKLFLWAAIGKAKWWHRLQV